MKRRDLFTHLAAHGCRILRDGSRHTQVGNTGNNCVSYVPRHREIKDSLVAVICKQLGIPKP